MRNKLAFLVVVTALVSSRPALSDGAARVALIDTTRLFSRTGIVAWADARAKLDAERDTYVAVESPDGSRPTRTEVPDLNLDPAAKERLRKRFEEIDRESWQKRAWSRHEQEVLDPIRAAVSRGLEQFAKRHGIDLVLDRSQLGEAVLIAAPGVDITDAFIKDYNTNAAPTRKPKAP